MSCGVEIEESIEIFNLIEESRFEDVKLLVNDDPKLLNIYDYKGNSILHKVAEKNNSNLIEYLIDNGADVNIRKYGYKNSFVTPIFDAINKNCIENVNVLIKNGAKVDAGTGIHCTPLMRAVEAGNIEIAKLLLNEGADINAKYSIEVGKGFLTIDVLKLAEMSENMDMIEFIKRELKK